MDAFRKMLDDRIGMFVHYGIYSSLAGKYNGKEIEGLGEWIQRRAEIPIEEYEKIGRERFLPQKDFAEKLVKSAKAAGMRYIVLTSKHHDGFALFKSEADGYNTYDYYGRDLCAELASECRKEGLEIGFYYSHTLDWHEKDAAGNVTVSGENKTDNRNFWDFPDDDIDFEKYFEKKCIPQVKELLTNYGKLKLIWFDYPHDITYEQSVRLRELVKELQPDCLINSRIGHGLCDYYSLGDNSLPIQPNGVSNECLITLNDTWGYRESDNNWKSCEDVIEILCRAITSDSTLLVNVGPYSSGYLTPESEKILNGLSIWTQRNSNAIYDGIEGNPLSAVFKWGYVAVKENRLFLYVKDKSQKTIKISGIENAELTGARLLGSDIAIEAYMEGDELTVICPETDMTMPVFEVTFAKKPSYSRHIKQNGQELTLAIRKAHVSTDGGEPMPILFENDYCRNDYGKRGLSVNCETCLHAWTKKNDEIVWDAFITQSGVYTAEIISAPSESDRKFTLSVGEDKYELTQGWDRKFRISLTGDHNQRFVKVVNGIKITFAGKYRIKLSMDADGIGIALTEIKLTRSE